MGPRAVVQSIYVFDLLQHIKRGDMDSTYSTHRWWKIKVERDHIEDTVIDGWITLNHILEKYGFKA